MKSEKKGHDWLGASILAATPEAVVVGLGSLYGGRLERQYPASGGEKNRLFLEKKLAKRSRLVAIFPYEIGLSKKKLAIGKIFIAEKSRTSYYLFCGYGNYENTYFFPSQSFKLLLRLFSRCLQHVRCGCSFAGSPSSGYTR